MASASSAPVGTAGSSGIQWVQNPATGKWEEAGARASATANAALSTGSASAPSLPRASSQEGSSGGAPHSPSGEATDNGLGIGEMPDSAPQAGGTAGTLGGSEERRSAPTGRRDGLDLGDPDERPNATGSVVEGTGSSSTLTKEETPPAGRPTPLGGSNRPGEAKAKEKPEDDKKETPGLAARVWKQIVEFNGLNPNNSVAKNSSIIGARIIVALGAVYCAKRWLPSLLRWAFSR